MLKLQANPQPLPLSNASFNLVLGSPINVENGGSYVFSITKIKKTMNTIIRYEKGSITIESPTRHERIFINTSVGTVHADASF